MGKVVCIIQARMSSQRLPGKVLLPLRRNELVLDSVFSRIKRSKFVENVVIATSTHESDDKIEDHCRQKNYPIFRGSLEDVLSRFYYVACSYQAETIVRVTADCPLVDYKLNDDLIQFYLDKDVDFAGINPSSLSPGISTEVFSFDALQRAFREAYGSDREHVTSYMYSNEDKFKCLRMEAPTKYQETKDYRLTLDTDKDYEVIKTLFRSIDANYIEVEDVVKLFKKHPSVATINTMVSKE